MKNEIIIKLERINIFGQLNDWIKENNHNTIEDVVKNCPKGEWIIWIAQQLNLDLRKLTLAKALCAKTVIHLTSDNIAKNAVDIAERFGKGELSISELNSAYAPSIDDSPASYSAYSAVYSGGSHTSAASEAAKAAFESSFHGDDSREANELETSIICREIIGNDIIKLFNNLNYK